MLKKVISGGQTGVDRAGLDAAIKAGIPVGGYCPKGRRSEDGIIPDIYPLQELTSSDYSVKTEKNVVESDGTLIHNIGDLLSGTKRTHQYAVKHLKPCLIKTDRTNTCNTLDRRPTDNHPKHSRAERI